MGVLRWCKGWFCWMLLGHAWQLEDDSITGMSCVCRRCGHSVRTYQFWGSHWGNLHKEGQLEPFRGVFLTAEKAALQVEQAREQRRTREKAEREEESSRIWNEVLKKVGGLQVWVSYAITQACDREETSCCVLLTGLDTAVIEFTAERMVSELHGRQFQVAVLRPSVQHGVALILDIRWGET